MIRKEMDAKKSLRRPSIFAVILNLLGGETSPSKGQNV